MSMAKEKSELQASLKESLNNLRQKLRRKSEKEIILRFKMHMLDKIFLKINKP